MQDIEAKVAVLSESVKGALNRIDEQSKQSNAIHELHANQRVILESIRRIEEKLGKLEGIQQEQGKEIIAMRMKPAARWESIVGHGITLMIGGIIAYFLAKLTGL